MTVDSPPSSTETTELVVPRSIPTARDICLSSCFRRCAQAATGADAARVGLVGTCGRHQLLVQPTHVLAERSSAVNPLRILFVPWSVQRATVPICSRSRKKLSTCRSYFPKRRTPPSRPTTKHYSSGSCVRWEEDGDLLPQTGAGSSRQADDLPEMYGNLDFTATPERFTTDPPPRVPYHRRGNRAAYLDDARLGSWMRTAFLPRRRPRGPGRRAVPGPR